MDKIQRKQGHSQGRTDGRKKSNQVYMNFINVAARVRKGEPTPAILTAIDYI